MEASIPSAGVGFLIASGLVAGLMLARAWRAKRLRKAADYREWSIGIREGRSPLELLDSDTVPNPVLTAADVTDSKAVFVADPFLFRRDSRWYMFFEVMEDRGPHERGAIGLATSPDGRRWTYDRTVLREKFHLSYPCVFQSGADVYMVPEACASNSVRLYKARLFPYEWVHEKTLLSGQRYVDPTLFQHGGRWWMFTSVPSHDELRLYYAASLLGPWTEHPASPIVRGNRRTARPAGRVVNVGGRLLRFAQDCGIYYGHQVVAFEITRLDETTYQEVSVGTEPVLTPTGAGWNMDQMHHLDAHQLAPDHWIASVDGCGRLPGWKPLLTDSVMAPKTR